MTTSEGVRSSDRILLKALELFSTKGYEATSVREICEASGITKPTLYHHYGSKEGVYRALVDGSLADFRERLTQALHVPGTTRERLCRMGRAYFEAAETRGDFVRFILGLIHNPPSSAPATDFPQFYEQIVALAARVVEEGVDGGELTPGPIELRMLVLMGALGEALCGFLILGRPRLSPELADGLVDTILQGWRA